MRIIICTNAKYCTVFYDVIIIIQMHALGFEHFKSTSAIYPANCVSFQILIVSLTICDNAFSLNIYLFTVLPISETTIAGR